MTKLCFQQTEMNIVECLEMRGFNKTETFGLAYNQPQQDPYAVMPEKPFGLGLN